MKETLQREPGDANPGPDSAVSGSVSLGRYLISWSLRFLEKGNKIEEEQSL